MKGAETPAAQADVVALARASGRAGESWLDFTFRDDVQALVDRACVDGPIGSFDRIAAAHDEGVNERRITVEGWKTMWTTAEEDYDSFGTTTVEKCGAWKGKELRRVIAHPHHANYQADRYGSGLHPTFDEDPRIADARAEERLQALMAEDKARAERRAAGLAWLAAATDKELARATDTDEHGRVAAEDRGLSFADVRDERKRRHEAEVKRAQAETWARCRALVPDGAILVDDGSPGSRGHYGWIKGRDPHVYYGVTLRDDYSQDADHAYVVGEGGDRRGGEIVASLEQTAEWIKSGRLRVVSASDVPPRAVLDRLGQEQIKKILRVEVDRSAGASWTAAGVGKVRGEGRLVWVGAPRFTYKPMVLDENGRIVRAAKTLAVALEAWEKRLGPAF